MPARTTPPASPDFESAMAELEAIVSRVESGELPLETLIDAYETGSRLLRHCEDRLASARQRVEKIARETDAGVETVPIDDEADAPSQE